MIRMTMVMTNNAYPSSSCTVGSASVDSLSSLVSSSSSLLPRKWYFGWMKNTIIITEFGFCMKNYELFLYEEYADHERCFPTKLQNPSCNKNLAMFTVCKWQSIKLLRSKCKFWDLSILTMTSKRAHYYTILLLLQ